MNIMNEILIQKYISVARFSKYRSMEHYEQNLLLSKQYYIPLSVLEVSLRNRINDHFEKTYGAGWLINEAAFLRSDQIRKIEAAKAKILERRESTTKDKLIAELSFGFWVNLFKKAYEHQMRINNLKHIFSNFPGKEERVINRKEIFTFLNRIRNFRNRIFYYEKIIDKPEYDNINEDINTMLLYLGEDILQFVQRLNHAH